MLNCSYCKAVLRISQGKPLANDEVAIEYFELHKHLALQKRITDRLAEVQHALHKFDEGTYGLCDNCGQQIDPARLEALPEANLCLSCKGAKSSKGGRLQGEHIKQSASSSRDE